MTVHLGTFYIFLKELMFWHFKEADVKSVCNLVKLRFSEARILVKTNVLKGIKPLPVIFSPHRWGSRRFQYVFEAIRSFWHFRDDNFFLIWAAIVLLPGLSGTSNIIEYVGMRICIKALVWMTYNNRICKIYISQVILVYQVFDGTSHWCSI